MSADVLKRTGLTVRERGAISRNMLSDQVKEYLLEEILTGRYPPGARVVETRVARDLGVSQGPVREALRDLGGLGFVDITAFQGARVRRASKRELLDAYEVRAELESLGARRAQARMSPAAHDELRNLLDAMQEEAARGNLHTEARLDGAFHARIMELSDNEILMKSWEHLEPVWRTYITLSTAVVTPEVVADLHVPILEALRHPDPALADDAVRRHFRNVASMLDALFAEDADSTMAAGPKQQPGAT